MPDQRARVALLCLTLILFIVIGSDGGPRKKNTQTICINQAEFQVVLYLTVQIYLEQNLSCLTHSCPFLCWGAPY